MDQRGAYLPGEVLRKSVFAHELANIKGRREYLEMAQ